MKKNLARIIGGLLVVLAVFTSLNALQTHVHASDSQWWRQPSQNKPYPNVKQHPNMWMRVKLSKQRVYIMDGNNVLYTMRCSSGKNNATPTGTYHIEDVRGEHFYTPSEGEGGNYYVAWKGHDFLFHSVPVDKNGHYITKEAKKLGHPASHGCVRLSVADAKWVYQNVPAGTKVVVEK